MANTDTLRSLFLAALRVLTVAAFFLLSPDFSSDADASASGPERSQRFQEVENVLSTIPTGRAALEVLYRYDVEMRFESGPTFYDRNENYIVINSNTDIVAAALLLVHESVHASSTKEGRVANVKKLSREMYIDGIMREEAEAEATVIEAANELRITGVAVPQASLLEDHYVEAYEKAVELARDDNESESDDVLHEVGRAAGIAAMVDDFHNGVVVSGTTGTPYPVVNGDIWDKVNPVVVVKN